MNIYEIRIDDNFVKNDALINSFLFECQCVLYLVDITNTESFAIIKELINNINASKYPYLKQILVLNKLDLESTRQVSSFELKEYLDNNKSIDNQEISVKNGDNIQELLRKINEAINESKNELPSNIVSEAVDKKNNLMNGQGTLSFILIGDSTVGKTCFLIKYTDQSFQDIHMATIGLDYRVKTMKLKNNKEVKIQIWDTAGQDRFRSITKNYYKGSHGIILIYDITNRRTFENVQQWISQIREETSQNVVIYLIGNKIDMKEERKVSTEEGKKLADELGLPFMETSAKEGININEVFDDIVERVDKVFGNVPTATKKNKVYKPKNSKCCK